MEMLVDQRVFEGAGNAQPIPAATLIAKMFKYL